VAADIIGERRRRNPVQSEFWASQIARLQAIAADPINSWGIFGEVVKVHIGELLIASASYQTTASDPLLRGGGYDYFRLDGARRITIKRPDR
jgi:hypothetical protein